MPATPATPAWRRRRPTYSPNEEYEHIYLTPDLYTWHCLRGVERGLADTDRCHHVSLRDRLTLFVWREKIVPTLGLARAGRPGQTGCTSG